MEMLCVLSCPFEDLLNYPLAFAYLSINKIALNFLIFSSTLIPHTIECVHERLLTTEQRARMELDGMFALIQFTLCV